MNVPIAAVAAVLAVLGVDESRDTSRPRIDVVGAGLVTAGLVVTIAGLTSAVRHSWTSAECLLPLTAGAVLVLGFVVRQRTSAAPLIARELLRDARFRGSAAIVALASFALLGVGWFMTPYLQNVAGYGAVAAGVRTLPLTITTLFLAPGAGKIAVRKGPVPVLSVGLTLTIVATIAMTRVGPATGYGYLASTLFALGAGLALALALPTATSLMLEGVRPYQIGVASGVAAMSRQVGGASGLAVLATTGGRTAVADLHQRVAVSHQIDDLVSGGQVSTVGRTAGADVRDAATSAFLYGFTAAMWVAAAAVAVGFGLALRLGPPRAKQDSSVLAGDGSTSVDDPAAERVS